MSFNLIPFDQEDAIKGLPSLTNFNNTLLLIQTINNVSIHSLSCLEKREQQETPQDEDSLGLQINQLEKTGFQTPEAKKKKTGCTCKKTNCLKRYCQCFSSGKICTAQCACYGCFNSDQYEQLVKKTKTQIKYKVARKNMQGCLCKKSQCQKKYCQCFNTGVPCTQSCKCIDCQNHSPGSHTHPRSPSQRSAQIENDKVQSCKQHTNEPQKIKSSLSFSYEEGIYGLDQ